MVRASVPLTCAAFLVDNVLATLRVTRPDPAPDEHLGGIDLDGDLAYSRRVAGDYLAHCPGLAGRVAEIGPGGNAAVALHLLAHGCTQVDLLDRFAFSHDDAHLEALYRRIVAEEPGLAGRIDPADLAPVIRFETGEAASAERFFLANRGYDAILSCAVMEHLYDPLGALEAMASALNPGGFLVHEVDLRDHGMFSAAGHHELTFLSLPSRLYPLMTRRRGRPNRVLLHRYREALERLGLDYRLLVCTLAGVGRIEPAPYAEIPAELRAKAEAVVQGFRPRLAPELRAVSNADLAVAGFFLCAQSERVASPTGREVAEAA
jgi:SAM-dependent methyltransferase